MTTVARVGWRRLLFRTIRFIQNRDYCELCDGKKGVRGNENIIGSTTLCDYCHAMYIHHTFKGDEGGY